MENVDPSNFSPTYYWDYFQYVLRYVDKHYKNLLNPAESQFISSFQALSFPAQCLYLRLAGRSVAWFNHASLNYSEIESLDSVMQELKRHGFVGEYDADVYTPALLQVLTKQTCIHALKEISNSKESFKSLSKQELVDLLVDTPLAATFTQSDWIKPLQLDLYHFCSFLFFGSKNRDLKEFVVRDLGHRQYVEVDEDDFQPYFTSRKEIEDKWQLSLWREWFYEQQDQLDPGQLKDSLFESIIPMAKDLSELAVPAYERLLFQVGRFLERQSYLEQSLEVYEQAGSAQALERRVRVLAKLKRVEEAMQWAEFGRSNVENPTELHFFQDFLARQASKKQVKQVTGRLKKAAKIEIDAGYNGRVEQGLIDYYISQGYYAAFSENGVWKNILGLLTWELIFTDRSAGFHHPFQYAPTVDFTQVNPERFLALLDMLHNQGLVLQHMQSVAQEHQGVINPLVDWAHLNWELIERVLQVVETPALQQVLQMMWSRLSTHAKGFPDLFIQRGNEYAFVEVKSPNDHLSAIQHFWHDSFAELGITVSLIRVVWK
ncbi:MAG: DNA-directed polymerase [Bacteroidota bacterium]|jgi:tetratricopeptide (TPR) repeat protein